MSKTKLRIPGSLNSPNENPPPETPDISGGEVVPATVEMLMDRLNEIASTVSDNLESLNNLASMVGDHESRLLHLGANAKPVPRVIFDGIDQSVVFSTVMGQVISGLLSQYPMSVKNEAAVRDYVNTGIMAGALALEELIKRAEGSHK